MTLHGSGILRLAPPTTSSYGFAPKAAFTAVNPPQLSAGVGLAVGAWVVIMPVVGLKVGVLVGGAVGALERAAVGSCVGSFVGLLLGENDGLLEGDAEGLLEGDNDGLDDGLDDGDAVGIALGLLVGALLTANTTWKALKSGSKVRVHSSPQQKHWSVTVFQLKKKGVGSPPFKEQ